MKLMLILINFVACFFAKFSTSIDESFVRQYQAEVHEAYQRMGSKLRNTIRTVNGVKGKSTTFQTVGKGAAGSKTRHGLVPVMNLEHSPVECTLADHYAGEWNDKLDNLKINHDERAVLVNAGSYAMGRKTDEIIIDALDMTTNQISAAASGLTLNKCLTAVRKLGNRDVPFDDGNTTAVIGWEQWTDLMQIDEFVNTDYLPMSELPYAGKGMYAKRWMGIMWMPHSGLPKSGNNRSCFVYHQTACGHAIGMDMSVDITWHGDRAAWFIAHMMSMGTCMIDDDGVEEIICVES